MTKPVDPENTPAEPIRPEDTPIEGTVFTPRQVGMLKVVVVVLGILLLAALAALIVGMMYQASKVGNKPPHAAPAAAAAPAAPPHDPVAMEATKPGKPSVLDIPSDANVVSMSLDGHRLALHVRSRVKAEIVVVDLRTGKVLSRLKIADSPPE